MSTPQAHDDAGPAPPVQPASAARRVLLVLTAALLLAWLGYLGYLAFNAGHLSFLSRRPVILSRPQLLVSNLVVLAQLTGELDHPDRGVIVKKIQWSATPATIKVGNRIEIENLAEIDAAAGWKGPGEYILPLSLRSEGGVRLTQIPASPGFPPASTETQEERLRRRLRIYPVTPETLQQLTEIENEYHR